MKLRAAQIEFIQGVMEHRVTGLVARRQFGKTTLAAMIALSKMMLKPGHSVVFGSVKVDLGREIVRKEAEALQKAFAQMSEAARAADNMLKMCDDKGKAVARISPDDFAEIYEAQRLELRLYHTRTVYSRTKVVALTPSAVGETGDLILDEVGRVRDFRGVWEAVRPIISSNPDFRCILTTTPPPDDAHYSYELLAPPISADFPVRPQGNWYRSDLGVHILRVTAWDAAADGVMMYDDDTGKPITPEESRQSDFDKDAWDRNYGCKFVLGGTSACGILQLDAAQRRGEHCEFFNVQDAGDFDRALAWMLDNLKSGTGRIGIGFDVATTTKETSNPSSLTITEEDGVNVAVRCVVNWKEKNPDVAMSRLKAVITACCRVGRRSRRLCIDGTNEKYFAQNVHKELSGQVPVEIVVASETFTMPGRDEKINYKQYLGSLLVQALDDNRLTIPAARYIREDWRLVKKEKGQFVCEPDIDGKHGDTFDSAKLGIWALQSSAGGLESTAGIFTGGNRIPGSHRQQFTPRRLKA